MKVQDIRKGFHTPWYMVVEDARVFPYEVVLAVRYLDGGRALRTFDIDTELAGTQGEVTETDNLIRFEAKRLTGTGVCDVDNLPFESHEWVDLDPSGFVVRCNLSESAALDEGSGEGFIPSD